MPTVPKIGVAVALLLVATLAVVLVTPDPSDDVIAVLHRGKAASVHALCFAFGLNLGLVVSAHADLHSISASNMPSQSLERLCIYRC